MKILDHLRIQRLMEIQRTSFSQKSLVKLHQGARFRECLTVHKSVVCANRIIGRELSRFINSQELLQRPDR